MIRFFAALFLLAVACRADDFAQGNTAYAAGNFADARNAYARAVALSPTANAWFNHGNASFRLNESGRAALSYERALLAQPNHPEAAANLKFIRNKTAARVADSEWIEKATRYAARPAASWLIIGEAWLGFACIAGALAGRKSRALLIVGILFTILGVGGIPALNYVRSDLARVGVVLSDRVDAKTEPADRAGSAETLPAASRVRIISEQGGWTYCDLPGGSRGWIRSDDVEHIVRAKLE